MCRVLGAAGLLAVSNDGDALCQSTLLTVALADMLM